MNTLLEYLAVTFHRYTIADHIYVKYYDILALDLVTVYINAYVMYYLWQFLATD